MNLNRIVCGVSQRIKKQMWQRRDNDIFVIMFHEVIKKGSDPVGEWNFAIYDESFDKLLEKISAGKSFISVKEAIEGDRCGVVVTFDDVYKSVFENAVPVLLERNIPFTVFITPSFLNKEGYLSDDDVISLSKEPLCTIGFHTSEHTGMRFLTDGELKNAIDAQSFREKFNIPCEYFAYPYGSVYMCPKRVRRAVEHSDFKAAFGTVHSGTNKKMIRKNLFYIPRLNVCEQNYIGIADHIIKK